MAGVCGACGETGFPGDDDADKEAGATLGSCRLDELEDLWSCIDDDVMESVSWLFASFIIWNLDSCATVRFVADSARLEDSKLFKFFLLSKTFKKSDMVSSSVWSEPELAPPASARSPEPGWITEEETLCRPLLSWSSSSGLLMPLPNDDRPRRWVKLLL